jgi:hypothetical protein
MTHRSPLTRIPIDCDELIVSVDIGSRSIRPACISL